jgi:hypothetical protein
VAGALVAGIAVAAEVAGAAVASTLVAGTLVDGTRVTALVGPGVGAGGIRSDWPTFKSSGVVN